jgi:hypothetical protein
MRLLPDLAPRRLVPQRLLLVHPLLVVMFLGVYFVPELSVEMLRRLLGEQAAATMPAEFVEFQRKAVLVACAVYGLVRAVPYHPLTRPGYKAWLEQTPWSARQPLPLGPVHLVWRDVLAIVGLTACGVRAGAQPALPAAVLGLGYVVALAGLLARGRALTEATLLAFGIPAFAFLWDQPAGMLAAAAILYCAGYVGLRRSLRAFPWRDPDAPHPSLKPPSPNLLGWPLRHVGPLPPGQPLSRFKGLVIAALVGWWVLGAFALWGGPRVNARETDPMTPVMLMLMGFAAGYFVALIRFVVYAAGGVAPPISTFGRILTGRLIIPRYDQILVAPLLVWVLAALVPGAAYQFLPVSPAAALALGCVVTLAAAINLGPTQRAWRLTGAASYLARPGMNAQKSPRPAQGRAVGES